MISEMNFFERIVYILQNYGISYLKGAGTTLLIALVSTAIGCVIGFAVGIVQTIPVDKKRDGIGKRFLLGLVKVILKAYVEIFRGTPMIVQAVFITSDCHRCAISSLVCGRQHFWSFPSIPVPTWRNPSEAVLFPLIRDRWKAQRQSE